MGLPGGGSQPNVHNPEVGEPSWFRTWKVHVYVCVSRPGSARYKTKSALGRLRVCVRVHVKGPCEIGPVCVCVCACT